MTAQVKRSKGQKTEYPKTVMAGSASVTIYRSKHKTNASGFTYELVWSSPTGRRKEAFADPAQAQAEAKIKVAQLAAGRIEGAEMTTGDRDELQAARKLAGSRPLLSILEEWVKAVELTGGHVLDAAKAWAQKHTTTVKRILVPAAVDQFIQSKNKAGKEGDRVYGSKLRGVKERFKDRNLDDITTEEWQDWLNGYADGVTRNDLRKRAVTLCRWAQTRGFLSRGVKTEVELTERAKKSATKIGIITPQDFKLILKWVQKNQPDYLAAITIAGFCGLRSDELHGKRGDRDRAAKDESLEVKRQTWENIDLAQKHLNVTNSKENTPAWRYVPICPAALEWLKLCPGDHKGPVCAPGAMEKIRPLLKEGGFTLPENAFRP
jgi:hypothetical protein